MPPAFDARTGSRSRPGIRLVLIEEGSRRPDALDAGSDTVTVTVTQNAGERPTAFALRAMRQVLALEQSGRNIACSHLLQATRCDPEVAAARLLIARGLITHAASFGWGAPELLLRAHGRSQLAVQHSLPCWMEALGLGSCGLDSCGLGSCGLGSCGLGDA